MGVANQTPASVANEYATIQFIVQQLLNGTATAALVRVQACTNTGGLAPVGSVDVQLLVDQITEDGQTIPHGTIYKAPYQRYQGGTNAVILDPEPGDIGVCVFAMRDSSSVKSDPNAARNRQPVAGAPPGSRRMYNYSDALYIGGMLNGVPLQFIQFAAGGITIKSPVAITLEAPTLNLKGAVVQTAGDVSMAQNLDVTGTIHSHTDVTADNISGKTHTHNDPQGGVVGPPNP